MNKRNFGFIVTVYFKRAIRNLYQLVLKHHNKEHEKNVEVDTDYQLKKVNLMTYTVV